MWFWIIIGVVAALFGVLIYLSVRDEKSGKVDPDLDKFRILGVDKIDRSAKFKVKSQRIPGSTRRSYTAPVQMQHPPVASPVEDDSSSLVSNVILAEAVSSAFRDNDFKSDGYVDTSNQIDTAASSQDSFVGGEGGASGGAGAGGDYSGSDSGSTDSSSSFDSSSSDTSSYDSGSSSFDSGSSYDSGSSFDSGSSSGGDW